MQAQPSFILYGLGEKALTSLQLLKREYLTLIDFVVVGKDTNVVEDYSSAIISFCVENKLAHRDRKDDLSSDKATFLLAIGWRWMIHPTGNQQVIVFHDSLLPRYRGFNPLVTALINGDTEIGVTALFGGAEYDSGDIIDSIRYSVQHPMRILAAIQLIAEGYGKLLNEIFVRILTGRLQGKPQKEEEITYSLWRDDEDYRIDWTLSAEKIQRFVYAVGFPYGGASTVAEGEEYIVDDVILAEEINIENRTPGKIIFNRQGLPVVVCGTGLVIIKEMRKKSTNEPGFPTRFRLRFK
jgi:methionyl-tRNA formyltransferase